MTKSDKSSPEVGERAVRMVQEQRNEIDSGTSRIVAERSPAEMRESVSGNALLVAPLLAMTLKRGVSHLVGFHPRILAGCSQRSSQESLRGCVQPLELQETLEITKAPKGLGYFVAESESAGVELELTT